MGGTFAESYWGPNLLFWAIAILLGLIPAKIAAGKGRSFVAWWIYGTLLFLFALIHAVLLKPQNQSPASPPKPQTADSRKCPFCGQTVEVSSKFCPHCGKSLTDIIKPIDFGLQESLDIPPTQPEDIQATQPTPSTETIEAPNDAEQPPLPPNDTKGDNGKQATPQPHKKSPSPIAIAGIVFGIMCLFLPYLALLFFVPVTFVCGIITIYKGEKKAGITIIVLAAIGFIWMIHVSNKINAILNWL